MNQPQWAKAGRQKGQIRSLYQCQCPGPITIRMDNWRVVDYHCNHSAFNGYHRTPSDYSSICCLACGRYWRTKAKYVDGLPMKKSEKEGRV